MAIQRIAGTDIEHKGEMGPGQRGRIPSRTLCIEMLACPHVQSLDSLGSIISKLST